MHNKNLLSVILLIISLTAITCKKGGGDKEPEPTATPAGIPIGTLVTKTIGSGGGNIVSADGMFELVIPAGALSTNTDISIQPITNFAPGGVAYAYRCLPDGQQFAKDITLKIHYTASELASTDFNCMGIAFQNSDRYWQVVDGFTNDSVTKIISVPVNHFTDYTIFDLFSLEPVEKDVKVNESVTFTIEFDGFIIQESERIQLLTLAADFDNHHIVWRVNGVENGNTTHGKISGDYPQASYTAPATVPSRNPVNISVDINLPYTIGKRHFNKLTMAGSVRIVTGDYKYSLHFEYAAPDACAYNGQNEFDEADMQIEVKDKKVTLSNIVNRDAALITPAVLNIGGGCTMTGAAGPNGPINIVSGTGEIDEDPFTHSKKLILHLKTSGAYTNSCTLACTGYSVPGSSILIPDRDMIAFFVLKDSLQKQGNKPGEYWELKPIP